jgi:hypothetical protein
MKLPVSTMSFYIELMIVSRGNNSIIMRMVRKDLRSLEVWT